jgi:hypothetical protein
MTVVHSIKYNVKQVVSNLIKCYLSHNTTDILLMDRHRV